MLTIALRTVMIGLGLALLSQPAIAAQNFGVLYPDGSYHYSVGYPGIAFPIVYVQRGHSCEIVLARGEQLETHNNVPVVLDDRTHWVAVGSRAGGQEIGNGQVVPVVWSIMVQPAEDADDSWLTIHTGLGNSYRVHLVAVARHSPVGQQVVGFYFYHPPHPATQRTGEKRVAEGQH